MKLLQCTDCGDIFNLTKSIKICGCGKTAGEYERNGLHAVVRGPCHVIGFANETFKTALYKQYHHPEGSSVRMTNGNREGHRFTAFIIPADAKTVHNIGQTNEETG